MKGMRNVSMFLLLLCGCAKQVPVSAPPTHKGEGWVAVEQHASDTVLVIAKDAVAEKAAMQALCGEGYICFGPDPYGEAFFIERKKK
jgi:hypothetical protein